MAKRQYKADTDSTVAQPSDETLRTLVGYNLKRASNVFQQDLSRTLKPHGLRMITYSTLVMIVDNPGVRQSQLAAALAMERSNCVVVIDELERAGVITRIQVPTDRRAYALEATTEGRDLCASASSAVRAHEAELLAGFTDIERRQIQSAMALIGSLSKGTTSR